MKKKMNTLIKKSSLLSYLKLKFFKHKWRVHNRKNSTIAKNCYNIRKVHVGVGTYGELEVCHFGNSDESLIIGNYCLIAPRCVFLLGGEHSYTTLSTFPFFSKYGLRSSESITKGPIIIDDDVWLGFGCIIMSGVHIGQGAIVAAGSVVAKDIPPYSIVGGVPTKIIKYRFSDDIRKQLLSIDFSKITIDFFKGHMKLFEENVDNSLTEIILEEVEKYVNGRDVSAENM